MAREKQQPVLLPDPAVAPKVDRISPPSSASTKTRSRALLALFLCLASYSLLDLVTTARTEGQATWIDLASRDPAQPDWQPCKNFEDQPRFQCATQEVPLDYAQGFEGGTATIALSKYVALPDRKKLGTVFVNPGGPGGSGQAYTFRAAPAFSLILEERYDILGFDPRGINQTLPRMACFEKLAAEREFLKSLSPDLDSLDAGSPAYEAAVRTKDLENQLVAERCELMAGDAGRNMGTTTVVRDIEYLASLIEGKTTPINFAGWSYGTVIGQYLHGMFPDRIGHVLIDGVCDPINWTEQPHHEWGRSDFYDSERTYSAFLSSCADVGPSRCALASFSPNATHDSLQKAIDNVLEDLRDRPMIVRDTEGKGVGLLRGPDVKSWIFGKLYKPSGWGDAAKDLKALVDGNGTAIYLSTLLPSTTPASEQGSTAYANQAVECSDAIPYPSNLTDDEIATFISAENKRQVREVSKRFSGAGVTMCPRWQLRETERFAGPWNKTLSNDILIIGNLADPITARKHAQLAHLLQPNSRLISHEGFGHCSTAMPSLCTALAIRNYFVHSQLPSSDLTCRPDGVLFPELVQPSSASSADGVQLDAYSVEERELLDAMGVVGEALHDGFRREDGSWGV